MREQEEASRNLKRQIRSRQENDETERLRRKAEEEAARVKAVEGWLRKL